MITFFLISAAITFGGASLMVFAMAGAPEGYQDESGFHLLWANNTPDIRDIACIWTCAAA